MEKVTVVNDLGQTKLVSLAAFAAGAYCGYQLAEGQHWAIRILAGFIGGTGSSAIASAVLG